MMTFSGKMGLTIILNLKFKKTQGLIPSLKYTFFEKPGGKCQTKPPSLLRIETLI